MKGGPYSEGAFPGGGQYGTLEVHDEGGDVTITLRGRTWDGRQPLSHVVRIPAPAG